MTASDRLRGMSASRARKSRAMLHRIGWAPSEAKREKGIEIDAEFQALIPPLSTDEHAALESSLLSEGCRDALVVWPHDGVLTLIDGHNRYGLCEKHRITYDIVEREFESREDVIVWMVANQLARRNLATAIKVELALKSEAAIAKKAKEHMSLGGEKKGLLNSTNLPAINTRAEIAAMAGTSQDSVRKVKATLEAGHEFIIERMRTEQISINRAEELSKALKDAHPDVVSVVKQFGVEEPDTVTLLIHLHSKGREAFDDAAATGHIQVTNESDAVPLTAAPILLYKAVEKKSDFHRHIGGQSSGGTPAALLSSDSAEWYTPPVYLEAVRDVLGTIDVDPASNAEANRVVQATTFYDAETNGLKQPWAGRVFLNPPYGKADGESLSNQALWSARLISQYQQGITTEAILLVNAITDAGWFQPLWDFPICFTDHRIPFYRPGGEAGAQPVRGSVFVYFGDNVAEFASVFRRFGAVVLSTVRKEAL